MRKRLFFIAIAFAVAMTSIFSSCSDKDEQEDYDNSQQAILLFMPWSGNSLYPYLKQNISSIEAGIIAQKGLKNSRLFVAIASDTTNTALYEITYKNGSCIHNAIESYDSKYCATTEGMAEIINKVKERANALNYAMIIGSHGTGWTSKDDWQNYPYNAKPYVFRYSDDTMVATSNYPRTRFFGNLSSTHKEYSIDIPTLTDAIKQTNTKMQYILFDNCYMANVEVAYELKDVTNFMIASTSEIMEAGMPYSQMWSSLATATPNYSQIVNTYYDFYKSYAVPYGSLAAIDCRQLDDLAKIMKEINAAYTFDTSKRDSLQVLDGFRTALFYDLGDYVDNLCQDEEMKSKFSKQLDKVVKYKKCTDQLYSYLYLYSTPKYITVDHFSGLTISAPSISSPALQGWKNTKWAKATEAEPKTE